MTPFMIKTYLNLGILASSGLLVLCGCDRKSPDRTNVEVRGAEHHSSRQTEHNSPEKSEIVASGGGSASNSNSGQLADELKQIFSSIPAGSMLSAEALARLSALVPRLRASGRFWNVIGAVPPDQLSHFRDVIMSDLRGLGYQDGSYVNPEFRNAYRVSRWLHDPEVASIAFEQLQKEKPFVYPQQSPVKDWPTAEHTEYLFRGNQGILATTVVELADEQTMQAYRKMLASASNDSQRVLIWALGRSHRLEDFELLIRLRDKIESPEIAETLTRSLNRIPTSMEIVVKSPESTSVGNRPAHPESLLEIAKSCRKRLSNMNLTVEPSFED